MLKQVLQTALTHSVRRVCKVLPTGSGFINPSVLAAMPARFMLRVKNCVQHKALFVSAMLALSAVAQAATPFGTVIPNTATANYVVSGVPTTTTSSASITTNGRTPGAIEFLQYSPAGVSTPVPAVSEYSPSGLTTGPFSPLPVPTQLNGSPLVNSAPGAYNLAPGTIYARGEPIFVRVTDLDQNTTAGLDTVIVTITAPGGETVTMRLTETGPATGVFIGAIQSGNTAVVPNNTQLTLSANAKATASYIDSLDGTGSVSDVALFDPFGIVFDSSNGQPVNGATVALRDAANALVTVLCDDGTPAPNPVISGAPTVCDPANPAGGYRFPRIPLGTYHLDITPPGLYAFPSSVPNPLLQTLANGPRALLIGSRGENFILLAGPALQIDVPLDPGNGTLQINKTANKDVVAIGDFVPYTITIKNNSAAPALSAVIGDVLPHGFRYAQKSAKLDNVALAASNPVIAGDGSTLKFSVGNVAAGVTVTLKYVAEVTAGAKLGNAENIAFGVSHASNTGRATVKVKEELYRGKSLLIGRVIEGCNAKVEDDIKGLQGARILLEDGTYISTDKDGRWHADNIAPGTHVVQLDKDSIPSNYEVMTCEANSRFAGRNYSQFVNIKGGTLWRADFYVQKRLFDSVSGAKEDTSKLEALPTNGANQREFSLVEKLPYNIEWLATAPVGAEWMHPFATFQPALPVIKFAVKSAPTDVVTVKVNGEKANPLNYDGALQNAIKTVKLSTWSAVPIKEGDNILSVTITDKDGKVVLEETRKIHFGVSIAKAIIDEKLSRLLADGKTKPVIAVRMLDDAGKPVRRGVTGEFELNAPYQSAEQLAQIQREPLAAKPGGKAHFTIGADGVASIELMPTTQTGEVVLSFGFGQALISSQSQAANSNSQVRAWLAPGQRDWVLVGFAEGTLGHKKLSGNMQALKASGAADQLFDQDRVAFYAKGTIKGDYLLTMAYDTAKPRAQGTNNLKQAVDPNQYYTLYADATQPQFDAASARKLYLKIEKSQFYAMFGDYDTGLTVTELSRYSRTLNGVKSEYRGKIGDKQVSYNAFATQTAQAFKKDEIRGDGTSGLYKLSSGNMVVNSDKVRIETRDRFRNEIIIKTETLTRYLDYDIDTDRGTLFFRQPIQSKDADFNPTYIVVEYESNDKLDEKLSYGGRAAIKPTDKTELGVSHVHEGNTGNKGNLTGVDATYNVTDKTKIRAEFANTNRDVNGTKSDGNAWLVEATHQDEKTVAKAYAREQEAGFGLGQQAGGENGTRKMGVDGSYKLNKETQLQAEAYRQETLASGAERNVAEAKVQWQKEAITASGGVRVAEDKDAANSTKISKQLTAGVGYSMFDKKILLRANTELGLGSSANSDFPNRLKVGADYKLNATTTLFGEQEFAQGTNIKANTTRVGLRTAPWQGAEMAASLGNEIQQDSGRLYAAMGLTQKWQINERWQADAGLDRSQTIKNKATQLNNNVPLASGGGLNGSSFDTSDFTAVSVGAHYNDKAWSANSRAEYRTSTTDDKVNLLAGVQRNLDEGRSVAAGFTYTDISGLTNSAKLDARLSAAYRPNNVAWIWLDRLDFIDEKIQDTTANIHTKKLINNFNANYKPNRRTQLALQYGAKYVLDDIDGKSYNSFTDLMGAELRYDVNTKWDVGVHGSMLHSWKGGQKDYALGASIGYNVMENTWISVGYNVKGFADDDFSGAEFRTKGLYLNVRVKFDQDTLGLNKLKNAAAALEIK